MLIEGTSGSDTIIAGSGNDIIFGGAGDDSLTGGAGADTFVWTKDDVAVGTEDTVTDFDKGEGDVLDLSDLLSDGSHTIEGIAAGPSGSEHLELEITDTATNQVVQTIVTNYATSDSSVAADLNTLLSDGNINDGI